MKRKIKIAPEETITLTKNKLEDLLHACHNLIASIKWTYDINIVNIAPKIEPIRKAVRELKEQME